MPVRRIDRQSHVKFEFLTNGNVTAVEAEDASLFAARFTKHVSTDPETQVRFPYKGSVFVAGHLKPLRVDSKGVVVEYDLRSVEGQQASDSERQFMLQEMNILWERYRSLEQQSRDLIKSIITSFSYLLIYTVTPFSFPTFFRSGVSQGVWGVGGICLSIAVWFYCDRFFRKYGECFFEKRFCLKQIDQIRRVLMVGNLAYHRLSLFYDDRPGIERDKTGDRYWVSEKKFTRLAYFFKVVSGLFPLYTSVFVALCIWALSTPNAPAPGMADPSPLPLSVVLRVILGCSPLFLFWFEASSRRCRELWEYVVRANMIGVNVPWPRRVKMEESNMHSLRKVIVGIGVLIATFNFGMWADGFMGSSISTKLYVLWPSWMPHSAITSLLFLIGLGVYDHLLVKDWYKRMKEKVTAGRSGNAGARKQ